MMDFLMPCDVEICDDEDCGGLHLLFSSCGNSSSSELEPHSSDNLTEASRRSW